ncbi:MAG: hypothetical protein LBU84_06425 [Prevotella sp.]|jgi:hypothetical protein|nr:hypothetical protein [Prevotella sp.]
MAENLKLKLRCIGIDTADVITSKEGVATAVWTAQPLTLRDDELSVIEADPEETEIYSHENDAAEDYDISGNGITATGSFIKATYAQMKSLLGGEINGADDAAMFIKSAKKAIISKAVRFRLKDGGYLIMPNAKGYVNLNANLGATDGRLKFPFSFKALASTGFDCDVIIKTAGEVAAPAMAPLSAPVVAAADTGTKSK